MRILILFILTLSTITAQSFRGLVLSETTYNHGQVKVWDNPPAVFTFENTSFDGFYFLAPKHSRNIIVEYPRNKIESGEKGEIKVYYYTKATGNFSEEIILYTSASNEPVKITIKGQIKDLADNALTSCPQFGENKQPQVLEKEVEGVCIDKYTKQPIPNTIVRFVGIESIYTNKKGEFKQKIPYGLYISQATAEGYRDLNQMVTVYKDMGKIVYELTPLEDKPKDTIPVIPIDTIPTVIKNPIDTNTIVIVPVDTTPDPNPDFSIKDYKANNIVFLIDVSGSMKQKAKIDSLKLGMLYLAEELRAVDNITVITFATKTNEIISNVKGDQKDLIMPPINNVQAKGTTNGVLGLEAAFARALENYIPDGNNIVIVATDGIFNGTNSSQGDVVNLINAYRKRGILLTVVGFGTDQAAILQMEKMAKTGGGSYIQFDSGGSARPKLVNEIKTRSAKH